MAYGKLTVSEINRLTLKEINSLEAKLAEVKASAEDRAKTELKEKIATLLEGSGFAIQDLYKIPKLRKKSVAKFMNPEDRTQTWTGMGRKPLWMVDKLAKGARMTDFEV